MKDIEPLKRLGSIIRAERRKKGFTQLELAAILDKDRQSLSRVECGDVNPTFLYLLAICQGLDIELSELVKDFRIKPNP